MCRWECQFHGCWGFFEDLDWVEWAVVEVAVLGEEASGVDVEGGAVLVVLEARLKLAKFSLKGIVSLLIENG